MSQSLSGIALVTGASRGIGRAIAERLAEEGMKVAVAARSRDEIEKVAQAIDGFPIILDVTDQEGIVNAVELVENELGAIDLLVNNAGIMGSLEPSWEQDITEWWRVFEVNVLGAFLLMQAVIPRMVKRGQGRVINISSQSAYNKVSGPFSFSAYGGSKAALIRITEAIAHEARPHGVSVFAMRPGRVRTAMVEQVITAMGDAAKNIPDNMWTSLETAGDLVTFIASGAVDSLLGRHIDAETDDWESLPGRFEEIMTDDLFALRLRR